MTDDAPAPAATVAKIPTTRARVEEMILLVKGLSLEVEAARVQQSYIGEIVQDLLRSVLALKTNAAIVGRVNH